MWYPNALPIPTSLNAPLPTLGFTSRAVAEALSIPVIANGDIWSGAEMDRVREETGCASVMLARPAMWNPSVFLRQVRLIWC